MTGPVLELRSSPHVFSHRRVDTVMREVVLALMPAAAFSIYAFGLSALFLIATAVLSCLAFEHLFCLGSGQPSSVRDWSAALTGLLFGLTLPPALPLWMVVVGGALCMGLGKHLFGGLGQNPFNPALVGRAVLQASFPIAMTTWVGAAEAGRFAGVHASVFTAPFSRPEVDGVTAATPLSHFKFDHELTDVVDLALGLTSGSAGETSTLLVALGGVWLIARGIVNLHIVGSVLGTVVLLSGLLYMASPGVYPPPLFMVCSGGLMLGAMFMATDFVGSPMTHRGCWVYGALIGALVVVIRVWGGMPEGVMYAILLGNALTPHLDSAFRPRVYGTGSRGVS